MNLPNRTMAAILVKQKEDLVVSEIELPSELATGQVLVEFHYSGICGSQLGEIDGVKGPDEWLPHLLGHEGSGTVLAIGPGVSHVKPGQQVVAHWRQGAGIQATPAKYKWNGCTVNAGWVTTFNQHAVVSENRLTPIKEGENLKTAALYGCAVTTGLGAIENKAKVGLGETVVVFGSGGIGLNLIQGALLAGASEIIAVDRFDNRLDLALKAGATKTINSSKEDAFLAISETVGRSGLDVFIDNTGNPSIIAQGYRAIHSMGRVVLVGVPAKGLSTDLHTLDLHFGKSITGTSGGEAYPTKDIPRYMRLFERRKIGLSHLITETGPLEKVNAMIRLMRSGEATGRCLIDFKAAT